MARLSTAATIVAALVAFVSPAASATIEQFEQVHIFGDSMSDSGRVYDMTLGKVPAPPHYWNGRFANGPNWADRFGKPFRDRGITYRNHAYGGAQASGVRNPVPGVPEQALIARKRGETFGRRSLVAMNAGHNDIFGTAEKSASAAKKAGRRGAKALIDTAEDLRKRGVRHFMMFDMVKLGAIPRYHGTKYEKNANKGSAAFNAQFMKGLARLERKGATVYHVPMFAHFEQMRKKPGLYGLTNVDTPCLRGGRMCENPDEYAFLDNIHPTAKVHKWIAAAAFDALLGTSTAPPLETPGGAAFAAAAASPVPTPLPAPVLLLLAGLAGLGLARRRAVRTRAAA